jgi:hypothetical protein
MKTYSATPQAVSRFLGANTKLERVQYRASRVRGWNTWNTGFEVRAQHDGTIKVEWTTGSHAGGSAATKNDIREKAINAMEQALATRYTVTRKQDRWAPNSFGNEYLVVTAK